MYANYMIDFKTQLITGLNLLDSKVPAGSKAVLWGLVDGQSKA